MWLRGANWDAAASDALGLAEWRMPEGASTV